MRPVDFWRLTFQEFEALCSRKAIVQRNSFVGAAMITATLRNLNRGKGVKPIWIDDILGPDPAKEAARRKREGHSKLDINEIMAEVRRQREIDEQRNAGQLILLSDG